MTTKHFKAPTRDAMETALRGLGWFVDIEGQEVFDGWHEGGLVFVKVLGTLYPAVEVRNDPDNAPQPQPSEGWHVDILVGTLPKERAQVMREFLGFYEISPQYPKHTIGNI